MNAEIYVLADKYNIPGRKQLAATEFGTLMDSWGERPAMLPIYSLVTLVYRGTLASDETLRKPVVRYAQLRWSVLSSHADVKTFLAGNTAFTLDLLNSTPLRVVMEPRSLYEGSCRACHSSEKWKPSRITCSCGGWEDI